MSSREQQSLGVRPSERKNQKNIYIHKINSLIKISRENLLEDEREISNALKKKKIAKVHSELDKNEFKLEKNRESAKRARLRKKLYTKLLEGQVERLKERQTQKFLKMISNKEQVSERMLDEVERYLSHDDVGEGKKAEQEMGTARMDKLIEEICQVSMSSSLRNIRQLITQVNLEEILRGESVERRRVQGEELRGIIKNVLRETEELRHVFLKIMRENEKVKKLMDEEGQMKREQEGEGGQGGREIRVGGGGPGISIEEFCSYVQPPKEPYGIFINLTEAERVLIQGSSFLELKATIEEL